MKIVTNMEKNKTMISLEPFVMLNSGSQACLELHYGVMGPLKSSNRLEPLAGVFLYLWVKHIWFITVRALICVRK